tara:strand:- start:444 stop:1646 length:1203 start_codon:yes stop_codon:yes gene_type:complete
MSAQETPPNAPAPGLNKRKAEGEAQTELSEDASSVSDPMVAEYLCPITQELPIEPVLAEDGRCYERDAIAKWLSMDHSTAGTRSPVTNELMGKRLVPATQVKNMLMHLTERGILKGETVDKWRATMEKKAEYAERIVHLDTKAKAGDIVAIRYLGFGYRDGTKEGLKVDHKRANHYFAEGMAQKDPRCTTSLALQHLDGKGVPKKNPAYGAALMMRGAMLGSEHACAYIGWAYANGQHDFPRDRLLATMWYRKAMTECDGCHDTGPAFRKTIGSWAWTNDREWWSACTNPRAMKLLKAAEKAAREAPQVVVLDEDETIVANPPRDPDPAPANPDATPSSTTTVAAALAAAAAMGNRDGTINSSIINAARGLALSSRDPTVSTLANAIAQGLSRATDGESR